MMNKKAFLCAILSLFLSQNASAFCDTLNIRVNITTTPGNVQYITTKSKEEFTKNSKNPVSPYTVGLTISNLSIAGSARASTEVLDKQICTNIGVLNLKIGYEPGNLLVYIDKNYRPGSCEYEVTRKHENYHVAVAQQAMLFFKPDIEKKVHEIVGKLRPQIVRSEKEVEEVIQKQYQQVMTELAPLLRHINQKIAQKNAAIDTPESYSKTAALCKNW